MLTTARQSWPCPTGKPGDGLYSVACQVATWMGTTVINLLMLQVQHVWQTYKLCFHSSSFQASLEVSAPVWPGTSFRHATFAIPSATLQGSCPHSVLCNCPYAGQQHAPQQHLPGTSVSLSTHQRDLVGSLFPSTEGLTVLQRSRATQAELEAEGKGR